MTCFEKVRTTEATEQKHKSIGTMRIILGAIFFISVLVVPAMADISSDMNNFSQIIGNSTSGFTGFTVNLMAIFMQPPLLYFVVLGIFVTFVSIVAGLLMRRGRRR